MRKSGKSVGCVNAYLRGMRTFVNWAVENRLLTEKLTLKELKQEQKPPRTFSDVQVQVLLRYKPQTRGERRLLTIVNIGLDTGARISEILGLRVSDIDLQNCLLTLHGKGSKTRIVPFSPELRKVLFKYLNLRVTRSDSLVFTTRNGLPVPYTNVHKEFKNLLTRLGIQNVDGGLHALRRWFISYCARRNVNPFLIVRLCGHERIETTQRYLRLQVENLEAAHVSCLQGGTRLCRHTTSNRNKLLR